MFEIIEKIVALKNELRAKYDENKLIQLYREIDKLEQCKPYPNMRSK